MESENTNEDIDTVEDEDIDTVEDEEELDLSETVYLMFRGNRKRELKIGRKTHTFLGRERKTFSETVLKHPDFTKEIKKEFVVTRPEVKEEN